MPFLTLNGLELDTAQEDFSRDYTDAESWQRSESMTYEGCLYREIREWSLSIPVWKSDYESQAQRGWIKGRGNYWTFERVDGATTRFNKYSADGGPGFGTGSTLSSLSKFGTWAILIPSGGASAITTTFGSDNKYSWSIWKRDSGGTYVLASNTYDGATTRFFAGTGLTTAFAWAAITAASGYLTVSLQGETQAGSSATAIYDGLLMTPYELTTSMLAARNARTSAEPALPYLELDGDCLEDLNPIQVKGFVDGEDTQVIREKGADIDARMPKLKLIER